MAFALMAAKDRASSITIDINNKTSSSKKVLIFGRNYHIPLTESTVEEAWRVVPDIPANGKATIYYPHETSVGVFYHERGNTISLGPYPAALGTAWIYEQTEENTATLTQDSKGISLV